MIKKVSIYILIFILGLAISFFVDTHLRHFIHDLFRFLTGDAIHFYGKDFHFFASPIYYLCFGIWTLALFIGLEKLRNKQKLIYGGLTIGSFILALIMIVYIDSHLKLAECTACNDGTRGFYYNDINYTMIILTSLVISVMPIGIRLIKLKNKPAHNKIKKQKGH